MQASVQSPNMLRVGSNLGLQRFILRMLLKSLLICSSESKNTIGYNWKYEMKKILGLLASPAMADDIAISLAHHAGATGEGDSACLKIVRTGSAPCKGGCSTKDE